MGIHVALNHKTAYHYDRKISPWASSRSLAAPRPIVARPF